MMTTGPEPTRRDDLAGLLRDLESLEAIFATWNEDQRHAVEAYRRAMESLHGEAFKRLIRALKGEPSALMAMKAAAGDEVVYAVLRRHGLIKPSLDERIEAALQSIRPMLASHGGVVELVRIDPPRVELRFGGACGGCVSSSVTFDAGVRKAIQDACPEITEVVQVKAAAVAGPAGYVSPFTLPAQGSWLLACALGDIPENGTRAMQLGGQAVLLFRHGAAVTCFESACAHLGLPIHDGNVEDGVIVCPHHGFRYELASGACLTMPDLRLRALPVRVVEGRVEVKA